MNKKFVVIFFAMTAILSFSILGCKGKVEETPDTQLTEVEQGVAPQAYDNLVTTEPAQIVATETIPPTAAPEIAPKVSSVAAAMDSRGKDIQTALKNAGLYTGAIDGKIGPKSKQAIEEFQKTHGLKVDGKVGPKTWAELEKYLVQQ